MFPFGPHYDQHQLKVQLKLAVSRIQIVKNKKATLVRDERKHIAELLRNRSEENARLRVEMVIKDESSIECFNIIEVLCELMFARILLIDLQTEMPTELKGSIYSLVYASQRIQMPELALIKKQLMGKYGRQLEYDVNSQHGQCFVNPKIIQQLSSYIPEPLLMLHYLNDIAMEYNVDCSWQSSNTEQLLKQLQVAQQQHLMVPAGWTNPGLPRGCMFGHHASHTNPQYPTPPAIKHSSTSQ
ncbi:hypothetical protein SAMD00019534_067980 [Acytostelium subglobosum LB1]|uniref:hypothetical protein n=1 Tax=Acytostelium subglobosum LB1 TaxID=1410327 RepID=UPI00064498DF|nr:hypothetical protein SAMD00019534_067980 [Acytostelium subglobosum LB1]GAM23623.1 hypothetical protein SAMD00019534_067980 [Acytostelium subglobosum LB1]|eukprot:XP_012753364.1 hypothetical protein SAMD00019534_067980 [Acytostelium subglobosum LB1]